jgi:O-antigen/teichoic acid export membrane protein
MNFVKNSIIYLGGTVLNKAIPFLLLPIFTSYLATNEFGVMSIYLMMISFFSAFIGMSLNTNISKNFFKYSKEQLALMIGNILILLSSAALLYFLITLSISFFYDVLFSIPSKWVLVIPLISFMQMLTTINLTILRNEGNAIIYGVFEIVNTLLNIGIALLVLMYFEMGWISRPIGIISAFSIFGVFSILYMNKHGYIKLKYKREEIKKILKLSTPLIPHVVGAIIIGLSDRFFIEKMISIEVVGVYSVGYMIGQVVMIFTEAFIMAWPPWFYKTLSEPTELKKRMIVKYSYIYILAVFTIALLISGVAKLVIPYFVDERYQDAGKYVFWIAIGYAIHGVYKILFPYIVHVNKTAFLGISTMIAAVLNLVFNYFLIDLYGAIGAAYATAIAFGVSAVLVFWYQNKHHKMPWI